MDVAILRLESDHVFTESGKRFRVVPLSTEIFTHVQECLNEETLSQLVQRLGSAHHLEDQMNVVREILRTMRINSDEGGSLPSRNLCLEIAVDLYLAAPMKHPLKIIISKVMNQLPENCLESVKNHVCDGLTNRMKKALDSKTLSNLHNAINALLGCYETLTCGPFSVNSIICDILPFLEKILQMCSDTLSVTSSPVSKMEISKVVHSSTRVVILSLQKHRSFDHVKQSQEIKEPCLQAILKSSNNMMNNADVPLDTRCMCGFVIVMILDWIDGSKSLLQIIGANNLKSTKKVEVFDEISSISICFGTLSVLRVQQLQIIHKEFRKTVLSCILDTALHLSTQWTQESCIILGVWRIFQQLTRILTLHSVLVSNLAASQFEILICHVWSHLDHNMDTVKHLARAVLDNLVQLKSALLLVDFDVCDRITSAIIQSHLGKRGRYVILHVMANHVGTATIIDKVPNLVNMLITSMQCPTTSSYASSAFTALVTSHAKEVSQSCWVDTWVMPLLTAMQSNGANEFVALEDALSKMVKLCPSIIDRLLTSMCWTDQYCHLKTLLTCFKIVRKLGYLSSISKTNDDKFWRGILPEGILASSLQHQYDEVRLSCLSLLVETKKSTETVLKSDLKLVKLFLNYNIYHDVPATRQQSLVLISKLLVRMKESYHCLHRSLEKNKRDEPSATSTLEEYKDFLTWLVSFSFGNIAPSSNFNSRFCSLNLLIYIQDIFSMDIILSPNEWHSLVYTEHNALNLLGVILVDTYEENKAIATKLLISFPSSCLGLNVNSKKYSLFHNSLKLASSTRPSECVSAAFVLELVVHKYPLENRLSNGSLASEENVHHAMLALKSQLEKELQCAERSLLEAASAGPMYGSLLCVRHLLRLVPDLRVLEKELLWQDLLHGLIDLSLKISNTVAPVVNSCSPEGHLPMDFNEGTPFKATAQMVLLCCWRSVKEVSLLLGELCDRCMLGEEQMLSIGDHLAMLLVETKHRGAFEQAYVGFSFLASRLWRDPRGSLHQLPRKWLEESLLAIQSDRPTTRRSAGVPFLVQALVSAELDSGAGPSALQEAMPRLLDLAAGPHVLTRTHAFNILRALMRHAALSEHVAPFIARGVMVAIAGLKGETWAERNSATLLFSSLMTRVFGVRRSRDTLNVRNKMTGDVFFRRYPLLYEYLLAELAQAVAALPTESAALYPVLLLLARLYPSPLEGSDSSMQLCAFVPWVRQCAGSSVMTTRVAAAKAAVPLITPNVFTSHLNELVQQISTEKQENRTHGLLLQAVHLLLNTSTLNENQLQLFVDHLGQWISTFFTKTFTKCSYSVLELFLLAYEIVAENWFFAIHDEVWSSIKDFILKSLALFEDSSILYQAQIHRSVFEARATRLLLRLSVMDPSDMECTIRQLLNHASYEVVQETLVVLEQILGDASSFQVDEEEENILYDSIEKLDRWVQKISFDNITAMKNTLSESERLGEILAQIATREDGLTARLAFRVIPFLTPLVWHKHIDVALLVSLCCSTRETISCAALSCFSSLLKFYVDSKDHVPLLLAQCCEQVPKFCSEEKSVGSRLVCVSFLLDHRAALRQQYLFLKDDAVCGLWMAAVKLISDEDIMVRKKAACLAHCHVPPVPKLAQELLISELVAVMGYSAWCKATLVAFGLGLLPDFALLENIEERVFDKGEMNLFHEEEVLTAIVCGHLTEFPANCRLTREQLSWIFTIVSARGPANDRFETEEDLLRALSDLLASGSKVACSEFVIPAPIASYVRRLSEIQVILCGSSDVDPLQKLPFVYSEVFGS